MSQGLSMPGGDPAALEQYAAQLEAAANGTGSLSASSRRVTGDIRTGAGWTGDAADGYTAFTGNLSSGVGNMESPLSRIASAVRDYAGSLRTAQQRVAAYSAAAQAAGATGHPADVASAQAAESDATAAVTAQQAEGDHAAAAVRAATSEMENPFGPDGPVRDWIEKIHAPWDSLAGDAAVARVLARASEGETIVKDAEKFAKELPGLMENKFAELDSSLEARGASWAEQVDATLQADDDYKAIWSLNEVTKAAGQDLTRGAGVARGVGLASDALGVVGDGFVLAKPEDGGAMGWVDRGVAGANLGLSGADGVATAIAIAGGTAEIPVAGQVALVGTGLYLGGDYLYHHWTPFRDVANDVGHATVQGADDVGHAAAGAAKGVWHGITSVF